MTQPLPPTSVPSPGPPRPVPIPPRPPETEGPGPVAYLALVFSWLVPGIGHIMIGQRARGIIFGLTIHLLFAAGMLLGGIRAINPADQPIWTYTQFLTGWPMLVANQVEKGNRDSLEKMYISGEYVASRPGVSDPQNDAAQQALNDERRQKQAEAYFPAHPIITYHPKIQDMGAVYCGIAGMLNLLVMFDVLLRITGSVREDPAILRKRRSVSGSDPAGGTP